MVRYISFVGVSLCISIYCLWYLASLNSKFNRLIALMRFLFHGHVDPTLLDSRVTSECGLTPKYTLRSLP